VNEHYAARLRIHLRVLKNGNIFVRPFSSEFVVVVTSLFFIHCKAQNTNTFSSRAHRYHHHREHHHRVVFT